MESISERPLISFVLITYNQESFIREAIKAAFSQTYSPLEIVISDDCSTDSTYSIIKELAESYHGPHHIILNRNEQNLGIGAHYNRVMELAKGMYIVSAAGDDVSTPHRVNRIYQEFALAKGTVKSVFSNFLIMDIYGNHRGLRYETPPQNADYSPGKLVYSDSIISGCSHAWSREVFDVFGPMITPLTCEDMVIPFRSALLGQISYIHEPLVMYRHHSTYLWNYKWHEKSTIDVDREIEFSKFWLFERRAIFKNWIKDLKELEQVSFPLNAEPSCLQEIANGRLLDIDEQIIMLDAEFVAKVRMILKRLAKKGSKIRNIRKEIGFYLFPSIYRKYLELKNRIGRIK